MMPPIIPKVELKSESLDSTELKPAETVAQIILIANDETLWRRAGLLLLEATDRIKYIRYKEPKRQHFFKKFPPQLTEALNEMYKTSDPKILKRRRARVLEILASKKVFEKYPDDGLHDKKADDVKVIINGVPQDPGNLDVCVWTTCEASSGEFYDCKAGAWEVDFLSSKIRLLNKIYNGLYAVHPIVGIISYQNESFLQSKINESDYPQHIKAVGFQKLFSSFRREKVCNCIDKHPTEIS